MHYLYNSLAPQTTSVKPDPGPPPKTVWLQLRLGLRLHSPTLEAFNISMIWLSKVTVIQHVHCLNYLQEMKNQKR